MIYKNEFVIDDIEYRADDECRYNRVADPDPLKNV